MGALHKFGCKFNGNGPEYEASGKMLHRSLNAWAVGRQSPTSTPPERMANGGASRQNKKEVNSRHLSGGFKGPQGLYDTRLCGYRSKIKVLL